MLRNLLRKPLYGKIIKWGAIIGFNLVLFVALLEGVIALLFRYPTVVRKAPPVFLEHLRDLYQSKRAIIQYDPDFAVYDPELFYKLKPNSEFEFSNLEFKARYKVNSKGLRDDEGSLRAPEVIFVGDSRTMGWGVSQENNFVSLVEEQLSYKVLNAGISSYGTVRELKGLKRLDLSNLKYLMLQYCDNDIEENQRFLANGNAHRPRSEREYHERVREHARQRRYFPGKYSYKLFKRLAKGSLNAFRRAVDLPTGPDPRAEALLFLNALAHSSVANLDNVKLVVYELNGFALNDRQFIKSVHDELEHGDYPPIVKNMTLIDTSARIRPEHYFVFDDHMNSSGHRAMADLLLESTELRRGPVVH